MRLSNAQPYGRTADGTRWLRNQVNYAAFARVFRPDELSCARYISGKETGGTYEHRVSYGFRFNVVTKRTDLAGGIGQARPSSKMAAWGADWGTNVLTQLRWMRDYAIGKYGSVCAAAAVWRSQGHW